MENKPVFDLALILEEVQDMIEERLFLEGCFYESKK